MTELIVGFASLVAGVLYPAYQSFKALKTESKEDDKQVHLNVGM